MANAIYWDTSALLKLDATETDSAGYLQLLTRQRDRLAISFLHRVELSFALHAKESRGEITTGSASQLFQLFEQHVNAGRYFVIPWSNDVAVAARQTLDASSNATPPVMLRSLDGIHLGAVRPAKIQSVVTADARMRDAARKAAISVIEP